MVNVFMISYVVVNKLIVLDQMFKLFVGGFPRDLEEEELQEIIQEYGVVLSVKIIRDKKTGISRRYGFIDMASKADGYQVIKMLNEGSIDGDVLGVKEAFVSVKGKSLRKRLPVKGNKNHFSSLSIKYKNKK